ncbi:uncharacterized protein N7503_009549 [Penicillium pulvis]|uniref:uncharacterized protein n=1 Tax=Penicillium pulvis TaxID=1562058 RepID=UPI0025476B23|nr:uncharacterized protein N7503_009549 [Penicillium pulvis]KAJ5784337.1 hypothetical protein N7503_009549 [Penicillium pulvis]
MDANRPTPNSLIDNPMSIQDHSIDNNRTIIHRTIDLPVPWLSFVTCLESRLGRYNDKTLKAANTLQELEEAVNEMRGAEPFCIFAINDHGALSTLAGRSQNARQYTMGNPRTATKMTAHDIRAGNHAPIVNLIYEKEPGLTTIEYDLAESVFGALTEGNEEVLQVARLIDQQRDEVFQCVYNDALKKPKN